MKSKKKQTPSWSNVKTALAHLDHQGLLELISDMYDLSKDNKDFLHIRIATRRGFDDLVFAAFSFDAQAQVTIQEVEDPAVKLHMAQIRPDVNMGDLLKTTVSSQLFTVSGSPRTRLEREGEGQYVVHMEGVDIYDPVTNAVRSSGAEKVAAWFLDSDYDGRCFCVCQAFFPDRNAWEKLGKALGGALDEEAFAKLSGTVSLPFTAGDHSRIAVKVIDPRGNEVLRVHKLGVYDTIAGSGGDSCLK